MANESEILRIDLSDTIAQIQQLQARVAALTTQQQELGDVTEANAAEYEALSLQIKVAKQEVNQARAAGEAIIKSNQAQSGSLKEMRAQLRQAELAYANLSKAERENGAEGKRLRQVQLDLRNALKAAEGATGDFRRNVGDYRNALKEAGGELLGQFPLLQQFSGSLKSATVVVKGFTTGFVGLTGGATTAGTAIRFALLGPILLLIGIGASLIAFFTKSKEGQDKFNQAIAFAQGLLAGIIKVAADFGKTIVEAFESPEKLIQLFFDNLVNRFKALGDLLSVTVDLIKGVFTGLSDAERKAISQKGIKAAIQAVTGISAEAQDKIAETALASANAFLEAEKRTQKLQEKINGLLKENENLTSEIEKQDKLSDNGLKTFEERERAADKSIAAQRKLNANLKAVAEEQLKIAKIKQDAEGKTKENIEEIAKLEAEVTKVQQAGLTKIADLQNKKANLIITRNQTILNDEKRLIENELAKAVEGSEKELKLKQDLARKTVEIEAAAAGLTEEQRKNIRKKGDIEAERLATEFAVNKAKIEFDTLNESIKKQLEQTEAGSLERLEFEKQANLIRYNNAKALIDLEKKDEKEKQLEKEKLKNDFTKSQADLNKQINDKLKKNADDKVNNEIARLKLIQTNEQATFDQRLKAQFEQLEKEKQLRLDNAKATGEEVSNILEEFRQKDVALTKEAEQKKAEAAMQDAQAAFGFISQLNDIAYQADLAAAGDNAEEKARIDAEYAKRQKRLKIFEITLNQSAAIAKTLADTPTPANFAVAVGVAAQIAALIGQVAALAFNKGGRVPGSGDTDTVPAMLTPGEVVINKRASERYLPLLDSINRSTGGAALIPQRLNTGGIVLPVNNGASGMSTEDLIAAFNQLPTPVVTVAAINRAQRNNVEVRQTATL